MQTTDDISMSNSTDGSTAVSILVTDTYGDIHVETTIVYYPEKTTRPTTVTSVLSDDSEKWEDTDFFDEEKIEEDAESTTAYISTTTQKTVLELPDDIW